MTSATHFKRGKIAFALGAILLLTAVTPFALVTAQNNATTPDDLVVVITPRNGIPVSDGKLGVAAIGTMFVFDYQLFHADGSPFLITEYLVDVHTVDGRATENPAADWPTLIFEETVSVAASSTGTIRIPAAAVTWYTPKDPNYYHEMPFGGMSLVFHATKDADGASLHTTSYPNGAYNIATADLVASGSWAEAGMADEQFTPLLLFNGQLSGLVQFANPILNPGFEIGFQSDNRCCGGAGGIPGFSSGIPPWFMVTNTQVTPQSTHYIQGAAGSSGSAVAVRYNTADNGEGAHFGQMFFEPGATKVGPWYGTSSVKAEFDMRARNEGSASMPNFHGLVTLHWADASCPNSECQLTAGPAAGVPLDDQWRHYVIDFGAVANGKQLNSMFFSFNLNGVSAPIGSQLVVHIDNVRLTGAQLTSEGVEPRNDLSDGYSAFVIPANTAVTATANQVVARLTDLNGDADAYVFRLSAMDYTGISVGEVDVVGSAYSVFQVLDETYVQTFIDGGHTGTTNTTNTKFFAVTGGENGDAFYKFLDSEGNIADEYLVVVPASLVSGAVAVPHLFVDVATDDAYVPTYGASTEPAHGFYSAARNNLMLTHLADSLDYSFTPIAFSSLVGSSMVGTTSITLDCPIAAVNVQCASDPTPDLVVTLGSDSRVIETATVKLVSDALAARADANNYTDGVVGEQIVSLPSGSVTFTLDESVMENLTAVGDMSVRAVTEGALFTGPAQTDLMQLDNFRPVAQIEHGSLDNLVKGSVVTFTSTAFDTDGVIEKSSFTIEYLSDPTNDADPTPPGVIGHSQGTTVSATIPDDGLYRVTLWVKDDGNLTDTTSVDFAVKNQKPVISISGPQFGRPGDLLTFTYTMDDVDGIIVGQHKVGHEMEQGLTRPAALPYTVVFTDNGTKTIWVNARDDDGARTNQSFTVLIDDELPTTSIQLLTEPAFGSNGWYGGDVEYVVARADVGDTASGVSSTTIQVVDGVTNEILSTESVGGDGNITRTISGDGTHLIKVYTTDRAGNSDILSEVNATVRIDTSKPTVTIIQPQLLDGDSPLAGVFFTDELVDIVVDATDVHSAVTKVEFFVDGGDAVGLDDDASDGWSFQWLASGSGTHEIAVVATNAAGLREISQTITVLVI